MQASLPLGRGPGRKLDVTALEGWLWNAACQIRGPLDAPKFKDYILPLVFLKRLSDVFDDEVAHLASEFGDAKRAAKLVEQDHKLDARALETIAGGDKPDTVKVFNLLKALHDLVKDQAGKAPYLISIGDKAEEIARAFEERQKTTKDTLAGLEALLRELREAEQRRDEFEGSPEGFAVYWLLNREGVAKAQEVARAAAEAFERHPHWQTSGHQEQDVRRSLYKAFIDAGAEGVVELAQAVMRMLRRASS